RLSQARFESTDGRVRVVGLCSKGYARGGDALRYWYGIKPSQRDFLEVAADAWIAFECESSAKIVLTSFAEFQPMLSKLRETEGKHWHVDIFERDASFTVNLPLSSETVDVTQHLV